jgi:hypothetical protein
MNSLRPCGGSATTTATVAIMRTSIPSGPCLVSFSSGGYLNAIAPRGSALLKPAASNAAGSCNHTTPTDLADRGGLGFLSLTHGAK